MISLSLALATALQPGVDGSDAAQAASVMRSYDLAPLRVHYDDGGRAVLLFSGSLDEGYVDLDEGTGRITTSDFAVLSLLQSAMSSEWQYEGRELLLGNNGRLYVVAPEETQAQVVSLLSELEAATSSGVDLALDLVRVPRGEMAGGLMPAEAANALLAELGAGQLGSDSVAFRARTGETARVSLTENTMHLIDYDVEIAQGAFIHDPITMLCRLGLEAQVRATALEGGTALALVVRHGEMLELREREIDMNGHMGSELNGIEVNEGPKLLQSPRVLTQSVVLNTFLPEGQALLLPLDTSSADAYSSLLVVRKAGGGAPVQTSGEYLQLTNLEALQLPAFLADGIAFSSSNWESSMGEGAYHYYDTPARAFAMLRGTNRDMAMGFASTGRSRGEMYGPWVIGPAQEGAAALPASQELRVANISLALYSGEERIAGTVLPVRGGEVGAVVLGVQDELLADYDVEVAQFAAVADPTIYSSFDGLIARVVPSWSPSGELSVHVVAEANVTTGEAEKVDMEGPVLGELEQRTHSSLTVDERVRANAVLGDRSGDGLRLVVGLDG